LVQFFEKNKMAPGHPQLWPLTPAALPRRVIFK
jgi:hypothetical protein